MLVFRCLQETQDIKSEFKGDIQAEDKNLGAISTKMAGERVARFRKCTEREERGEGGRVYLYIRKS